MTTQYDPLQPFTREMGMTMTEAEVLEFWRARQRALRERGEPHFERVVDPMTDRVVTTIDEGAL